MINIQATGFVKPIEYERNLRQGDSSGSGFDELREISNHLKIGLEGFAAWIQIFAVIPGGSGALFLESACRELTRIASYFNFAYARLINYLGQIPRPKDVQTAFGVEQLLAQLFNQLTKETRCELGEYGWTSWGERISPQKTTIWANELIQQLFSQISVISWQKAQNLILDAKNHLQ